MANMRILATEEMVGYGHGTKADTLNRLAMIEHGEDGVHGQTARKSMKAQPGAVKALSDGATIAIDWDNGATQYVTLGATGRTVTFANPREGEVYRFIIIQDGTGSRTITTWPMIKWAGGSAPTLTTTGGKADVVTLLYANSSYYGDCSKVF